jgi:hypothetical protein
MEQRRVVLDLPAAGPQLELAAAVRADPLLSAVLDRFREPPDAAEPRRLDVERARREWQLLDVLDRVDDRVPRDPVAVRLEDRVGLLRQRRVFEKRLGKRFDEAAVEGGIRGLVDDRPLVLALQVERLDDAQAG